MLTIDLISGDSVFDELSAEWDDLVRQGVTNTPFQKHAYQKSWWRHLGPVDAELATFVARDENAVLRGIASFYLLDGVLYFNGTKEESDYLDCIVALPDAASFWSGLMSRLRDPSLDWHALDLYNIPAQSPTLDLARDTANQHGLQTHCEPIEVCPVITLPEAFDGYLEMLDGKQRREVKRKLRRASAAEMELEIYKGREPGVLLSQQVDEFLKLLTQSTPEKSQWLNEGRISFFHDIASSAAAEGTLQLIFTSVESVRAAALFNFDYDGRIWVYNSGLDPTAYGYLSPGVVLTAQAIRNSIELGRHTFDFLRGDEAYKYRFGAQDTEIYRLHIAKASAAGRAV